MTNVPSKQQSIIASLLGEAVAIPTCTDLRQLQTCIESVATQLGCDRAVFRCTVRPPKGGDLEKALSICAWGQTDWCKTYYSYGYHTNDPFVDAAKRGQITIGLSDVNRLRTLSEGQRMQLLMAAKHGYNSYVAISAHSGGTWMGMLYFGHSRGVDIEPLIRAAEPALHYITRLALDRSKELLKHNLLSRFPSTPPDTMEQLFVLLIRGCETPDIAVMLDRTQSSVYSLIRRTLEIMNCERREDLATQAVLNGIVDTQVGT